MILLRFVDDVLDVPWRVQKITSAGNCCTSLVDGLCWTYNYYYTKTSYSICQARGFGSRLFQNLDPNGEVWTVMSNGWIYKLHMGLLAVFCTNSINIHAGINGLEVGQTVVIASAILIHNVMQIGASADPECGQTHAFSIYLVQPLLATSLALLSFNWYPSSVFVGDTYTYFAGMTMAVVGILGHFSLLALYFVHGISCPVFRFDPQTRLLTRSTNDGTLVNLFLRKFGRMSEKSLCILLLVFQTICCCFCFILRWILTGWYK